MIGRCERKGHLMFRVVNADLDDPASTLVVEAPRFAVSRERKTWTPIRRELTLGMVSRYGCACGRSELIADDDLWADIRRGVHTWVVAATNISSSRSGMGE